MYHWCLSVSTREFWKKRAIGQVSHYRRNVMSQTPVVSMTTRLIDFVNIGKLTFF